MTSRDLKRARGNATGDASRNPPEVLASSETADTLASLQVAILDRLSQKRGKDAASS